MKKPTLNAGPERTNDLTNWRMAHDVAVHSPRIEKGEAIVPMLKAWVLYADGYRAMYPGQKLADDYVLGEAWKNIGTEIRTLLNGVAGRLDCGTLDAFILDTLAYAGFDTSAL